jgi:hypothetical protein
MLNFTGGSLINIDITALGYLISPLLEWANTNDCGNWPCTGPNSALINF